MSAVQGKSPPVQVKEPYGNLDMVTCRLSSHSCLQICPNIVKEYDQEISQTADNPRAPGGRAAQPATSIFTLSTYIGIVIINSVLCRKIHNVYIISLAA